MQQQISSQLPPENLPYAIRLKGISLSKSQKRPQATPPYHPFNDVMRQQRILRLRNVQGTLGGFRLPQFIKGVNAAGYHFIARDRKAGGHLLDGEFLNSVVDVETLQGWQMMFLNHPTFEKASLK